MTSHKIRMRILHEGSHSIGFLAELIYYEIPVLLTPLTRVRIRVHDGRNIVLYFLSLSNLIVEGDGI